MAIAIIDDVCCVRSKSDEEFHPSSDSGLGRHLRIRGCVGFAAAVIVLAACGSTASANTPKSSKYVAVSSTAMPKASAMTRNQTNATDSSSSTTQTPPGLTTVTASTSKKSSVPSAPGQAGLEYGPGPQATYEVQPQPFPGSCHYTFEGTDPLPDPRCTPGALNPNVTQSTISSTICESGYTSSIRPPESVTEPEKRDSASAYSYTGSFSTAEYDHLVPLELGGDPNDPANLWIEPNDNPSATSFVNSKDNLENRLRSLVCAGGLSLSTAQKAIASNWVVAYRTYVGNLPSYSVSTTSLPVHNASCTASAVLANDGYRGDYYVTINSNQPDQKATASDAGNRWSDYTNSSGYVRILLYYTSPGEQINVTVGSASCSTTA